MRVYVGGGARNACVYVALHALLGTRWNSDGRAFVGGIIEECNGFPIKHIRIVEECAPVRIWHKAWSLRYEQGEAYVTCVYDGYRYKIPYAANVVFIYGRDDNSAHALCAPIHAHTEITKSWFHSFITDIQTPTLRNNV